MPAGVWQGSRLEPGVDFALLGATMAPGFDYADYEQGRRSVLAGLYPGHAELIRQLTRGVVAGRAPPAGVLARSRTVPTRSTIRLRGLTWPRSNGSSSWCNPGMGVPRPAAFQKAAPAGAARDGPARPRVEEAEQSVELVGGQESHVGRDHDLAEPGHVQDRTDAQCGAPRRPGSPTAASA